MSRRPHLVCLAAGLGVLAGCGGSPESAAPPGSVVDLGPIDLPGLPEPFSDVTTPTLPTAAPTSAAPGTVLEPGSPPLRSGSAGALVDGNRVLVIGDSIVASTAPRYGGLMCDVLSDFGWSVEIAADTGRFVEYGEQVLDYREAARAPDLDAAVVMLGNNYRGDYEAFTAAYDSLLDRLAPRPTVIFTLTEDDPAKAEINDFIEWRAYFHPNVVVVDWAGYTGDEPERLLGGDGLHLSSEGRRRLVLFTAAALGTVPESNGRPGCQDGSSEGSD